MTSVWNYSLVNTLLLGVWTRWFISPFQAAFMAALITMIIGAIELFTKDEITSTVLYEQFVKVMAGVGIAAIFVLASFSYGVHFRSLYE